MTRKGEINELLILKTKRAVIFWKNLFRFGATSQTLGIRESFREIVAWRKRVKSFFFSLFSGFLLSSFLSFVSFILENAHVLSSLVYTVSSVVLMYVYGPAGTFVFTVHSSIRYNGNYCTVLIPVLLVRGVIWLVLGGAIAPLKTQVAPHPPSLNLSPTPPKPQEVTTAGFPLFLSKFKCVITLASLLVSFFFFFFFFFGVTKTGP